VPTTNKFFRVVASVAAAFFGVQSKKSRKEDFQAHHKPRHYIMTGVAFTLLFVLTIAALSDYLVQHL
jgi:hypothetical protein